MRTVVRHLRIDVGDGRHEYLPYAVHEQAKDPWGDLVEDVLTNPKEGET